jgi:hypothetical protein
LARLCCRAPFAAIPSLEPHQIIVRMKQITALVGDGHTGLHVPPYFRLLPIALFWFGPDLRVLAAAAEYREAAGARVVEIGGLGIADVQARVATCFPSAAAENEWYVLNTSSAFIIRPEILHALGIVADPARVPVTFEGDDGRRFTLDLVPIAPPPVVNRSFAVHGLIPAASSPPLFRQRPGEPFWFRLLPDSQTVYVSFRNYRDLGEHAHRLFQFLDRTRPARLIIDLRQNGGGDFYQGRKHLIEPPKRRPQLTQKGRLYVVVGRATYSAGLEGPVPARSSRSTAATTSTATTATPARRLVGNRRFRRSASAPSLIPDASPARFRGAVRYWDTNVRSRDGAPVDAVTMLA